ncbi:MAG: NRDE family protein, partial [Terriglobus roseus]|nr:NRDE family protein [Terriglobus roseus]
MKPYRSSVPGEGSASTMCIAILTTAHPSYPLILLSNRDEYLARPTHAADFWPAPDAHVLGGWDLERAAHGTWLGVTTAGRLACLTNYHEKDTPAARGAKSRGIIVNGWLKGARADETPEEFAARTVADDDFNGVGGFTLTYGYLRDVAKAQRPGENGHIVEAAGPPRAPKGLPVLSNRTAVGA